MKTIFRRFLFLTIILGALLMVSPLLTPGVAHAAAKKANAIGIQNDCSAMETDDLVIATDYGWDVDCFSGDGKVSVGLYDVTSLQTGEYTVTIAWKDYDGGSHTTTKAPEHFLAAGNAGTNAFAGYDAM